MMGKLYKDGNLIYSDAYLSKLYCLQLGFKEIIERIPPKDYTPEIYKIVYIDSIDGIIKTYEKI